MPYAVEVELMDDKWGEIINPRKYRWTIYGSFVQIALILVAVIAHNIGWCVLPLNPNILLGLGFVMALISIKNSRTKYGKLDCAVSIQPIYCQKCKPKQIPMLPKNYQCPECKSTFNVEE